MERREYIKGIGALTIGAGLAGCGAEGPENNFKITDLGLSKKDKSAASYVEVENMSEEEVFFECTLAVFTEDDVRVSDWEYTRVDSVQPGNRVRAYVVWESGDSGWDDTNDLGQVLDSHKTKTRVASRSTYAPVGPILGEESIGKRYGE